MVYTAYSTNLLAIYTYVTDAPPGVNSYIQEMYRLALTKGMVMVSR